MMSLKDQHDKLLEEMPEGASHDTEGCPFCNPSNEDEDSFGGGDMKTYTEEEFTAAVNEAVAPIQAAAEAKVAELEAVVDSLKADKAKFEADSQISDIQAQLDKAEIRVAAAEQKYDDLISELNELAAEEQRKAEEAARREERLEVVKASAFSDEYVAANIDRWVAMSDEDFTALVEDWKAVSSASREEDDPSTAMRETAMQGLRKDDSKSTSSVASDVFGARNRGIDIKAIY